MENDIAELREQLAALIEDRARFPDRPDFIGNMISAHIGNLKAGKASSDEYARTYILRNDILQRRNDELVELLSEAFLAGDHNIFGTDLNERLASAIRSAK